MNKSVEKLAKTVDEAVEEALRELKISMDQAIIEVLDEGEAGGLLGFGRRPARVRVSCDTEEENSPAPQTEAESSYAYDPHIEVDENYEDSYQEAYEEQSNKEERPYHHNKKRRERQAESASENYNYTESEDFAEDFTGDDDYASHANDYSPEEKEVLEDKAVEFVASILQSLGIHGRISSFYTDDGSLRIDVSGEDLGNAIGRRGETLDAIQYLTTLAINQDHNRYQRIFLDIDYYRDRQMKQIRSRARKSAERVLKSGRRYVMNPMSPAERRQVHLALADFQGVTTYSEGKDPNRSVVITREGQAKRNRRNYKDR